MSTFPGVGYSPDPGEISDYKLTNGVPLDFSRDPWPGQWYGGTGVPRLAQVKPAVLDVPAIEARYGRAPQPPTGAEDAGTVILPMSAGTIGNTYHESDAASFLRELWLIEPGYFRPGGDGFPTITEVCDLLATSVRGSGARLIAHWLSLPRATRPDFVPDPWVTLMAMEHWNRMYWDQWLKAHGAADLIPKAMTLAVDIVRREGEGADASSGPTGSTHFPPSKFLELWDKSSSSQTSGAAAAPADPADAEALLAAFQVAVDTALALGEADVEALIRKHTSNPLLQGIEVGALQAVWPAAIQAVDAHVKEILTKDLGVTTQ